MKTKIFFKAFSLVTIMLMGSLNASAESATGNLIYNSEEKDGLVVAQTVYKLEGQTLANYMKYNFQYDDQQRITENKSYKWNDQNNRWENDLCIRNSYSGNMVTTQYLKWNDQKQEYILVPEMTVTMDYEK